MMNKKNPQCLDISKKKAIKDAQLSFSHFFDCYHLPEVKEELWEWFSAAITRENSIYDDGVKRNNLVTLYENLELLIDAAWKIHSSKQDSHL